jgi:hypothetical protein
LNLFILLIIPTIIAIGFLIFGKKKITLLECLAHLVGQALVVGLVLGIVRSNSLSDIELHNGVVESKQRKKVSCSHSYQCNCRNVRSCSGSGKTRSCSSTRVCQTCYEHSYDVSWYVNSNIKHYTTINRVDRRGLKEPPRWSAINIGEPMTFKSKYQNYIKADPETLFTQQGLVEKYKGKLLKYPKDIYDYYNVNRIVDTVGISNKKEFNKKLSQLNGYLGPIKQVNIVLVFIKKQNREYYHALREHWLGGKKNDVIIVMNVQDNIIEWAEIMAWTKDFMVQTYIRDKLEGQKVDQDYIISYIKNGVLNHYKRKPMKEFEYLKDSYVLSTGEFIFCTIFSIIASILLGIFFLRNEIEE